MLSQISNLSILGFRTSAAETPLVRSHVSLSGMIERFCAEGNFEQALEFAQIGINRHQQSSPTHPGTLRALANYVRVAVSGKMTAIIPDEYVSRLESAIAKPRTPADASSLFIAGSLVEFYSARKTSIDTEFKALQKLDSMLAAPAAQVGADILKLSCKIALESSLGMFRVDDYRYAAPIIFGRAESTLSVHSPGTALYYRGFADWITEEFTAADTTLHKALSAIDRDIALGPSREDQLMKLSIMELRMRVSLSKLDLPEAERRAFELINRAKALGQSDEIVRRCNYFLAEVYYTQGNPELSKRILTDLNLPQLPGEVRENALRFQRKLRYASDN